MIDKNLHFKNEVKKIKNYFNIGKYEIVIQKSKILLKKKPEFVALYNIIGISFQRQKRFNKAKDIFLKGLLVDATSLDLRLNLANTYKADNDFKSAEELYKKILEINPNHFLGLFNYGNLKNDLNLVDEAISLYDKAIEIDNNNFGIHFNKAFILQAIGKFEQSIFHANKCLELNTNFTPADSLLSKMIDYKKDKSHLENMLRKVKNKDSNLNTVNLYNLHFAIGVAYEKIGDKNLSIKFISEGNKIKRDNLKFHIEDEIQIFNKIKDTFKNLDLERLKNNYEPNDKNLIFILGMPRSGTTLVEQIISSHSKVFGAGELFTLANIIKDSFFNLDSSQKKLTPDTVKTTNFEEWKKQYQDYLLNFKSDEKFLTDKNPLNFLWIGFIKIVFPNAKIIHCHRSPEENCLSIYKNLFPGNDLGWTYNQSELATYYNLYSDLMKFWHNLFPGYIFDVTLAE